jgi:K+-sensing histidine kinase KdpD
LPTEQHASLEHLDSNNQSKFIKFRIEIADTGVGIKKEDIDKLFVDFSRLDKDMNMKGTGLGLSICKKMIERMGGKVDVDSEYGVGTTFKVILQTKVIPQKGLRRKAPNQDKLDGDSHSVSISNNQSSVFGGETINSNSDL